MIGELDKLIIKYKRKGIIIDSNLLLLYFIGEYQTSLIESFSKTSDYTMEDFELLRIIIEQFEKIITTPNILTEVGNLAGDLPEQICIDFLTYKAKYIQLNNEKYVKSKKVGKEDYFSKFGLTDSSIIMLTKKKFMFLSADLRLVSYMQSKNIDAINFNNVRTYFWK